MKNTDQNNQFHLSLCYDYDDALAGDVFNKIVEYNNIELTQSAESSNQPILIKGLRLKNILIEKVQEGVENKFQQILNILNLPLEEIKIDNVHYTDDSNLENADLYTEILRFIVKKPKLLETNFFFSYTDQEKLEWKLNEPSIFFIKAVQTEDYQTLTKLIQELDPRQFITHYLKFSYNGEIDWNKIIDGETLFFKLCNRFLQEYKIIGMGDMQNSLFPLISSHTNINANQPLDKENNTLLHKFIPTILKVNQDDLKFLKNLLHLTKKNQELFFNVNKVNNEGNRIIDLVAKTFKMFKDEKSLFAEIIKTLRALGSVEPKDPISINELVEKLDLTELDKPVNHKKIPKILEKLYKKYPLNEQEIIEKIDIFKTKILDHTDYKNWQNYEWGEGHEILTIPAVIDLLSQITEVRDRLPDKWNFQKIIGLVITIADSSDNLTFDLVNCLSQLKMCNLGKLVNLLCIIQDKLLEDQQSIDYDNNNLTQELLEKVKINIESFFGNKYSIGPAITQWYYAIQSYKPQEWKSNTLIILGFFNQALTELNKDIENKFDSYHYTTGLLKLINPLLKNIEAIDQWKDWYKIGLQQKAEQFCQHALLLGDASKIKLFIQSIWTDPEYIFGQFVNELSFNKVEVYYKAFVTMYSKDIAIEFLKNLLDYALVDEAKVDTECFVEKITKEEAAQLAITKIYKNYENPTKAANGIIPETISPLFHKVHMTGEEGTDNEI